MILNFQEMSLRPKIVDYRILIARMTNNFEAVVLLTLLSHATKSAAGRLVFMHNLLD
jgi:hypothetical protein